uniref:Uncharacterized protein n=1 Tax=Sphaerodactylus townsendi TaxID=933632 RepID=A0ACB8GAC0_9SAUR
MSHHHVALGQAAGFTRSYRRILKCGSALLPVLGIKSLSPICHHLLDRLRCEFSVVEVGGWMHPNLTKGFGMIGPKDFLSHFDFAFVSNNLFTNASKSSYAIVVPAESAGLWGQARDHAT